MFVLAQLVALGYVRIKIVLAVELRVVGQLGPYCRTYQQHFFDRLFVYNRKRTRVCHAHRAYIFVWLRFVGVVDAGTKHLGVRLQFCMYFKPDCWPVHIYKVVYLNARTSASCSSLTELSSRIVTVATSRPSALNSFPILFISSGERVSALVSEMSSGFCASAPSPYRESSSRTVL